VADVMATGEFPTSISDSNLDQVADLMHEYNELPSPSFDSYANSLLGKT
jgi:hypothetical protein